MTLNEVLGGCMPAKRNQHTIDMLGWGEYYQKQGDLPKIVFGRKWGK